MLSASGKRGGAKQPLTRALPLDHAGVSAPIPPVIGFMAG